MRVLMEGAAAAHELPMAPMWFGLIALAVFALSLAATYAFQNVSHRHDPASVDGGHAGAPGSHGHSH